MLKRTQIVIGLSIATIVALVGCGTNGTTSGQQSPESNGVQQQTAGASGPHNGFGRGQQFASISKVLGMSATTLMDELKSGQTLAQIAQSKGISQQKLISELEASYKSQLDQGVSSGHLTSSQEQQMISKYDQSLPKMIQKKGMSGWSRRGSVGLNNQTN